MHAVTLFATLCCGAILLACGEDERSFSAPELIGEMNAGGAGLALGPPLDSTTDGVEVTTVTFDTGLGPAPPGGHGSGAIVVLDDADAARVEFERCSSAPSLICFRAANSVLRFSQISPRERARIESALRALVAS